MRTTVGCKRKVIDYLTTLPIHIKTVPSFSALVSGLARVGDIVDVDVEDLLGRETVPPQPGLLTPQCIIDEGGADALTGTRRLESATSCVGNLRLRSARADSGRYLRI